MVVNKALARRRADPCGRTRGVQTGLAWLVYEEALLAYELPLRFGKYYAADAECEFARWDGGAGDLEVVRRGRPDYRMIAEQRAERRAVFATLQDGILATRPKVTRGPEVSPTVMRLSKVEAGPFASPDHCGDSPVGSAERSTPTSCCRQFRSRPRRSVQRPAGVQAGAARAVQTELCPLLCGPGRGMRPIAKTVRRNCSILLVPQQPFHND